MNIIIKYSNGSEEIFENVEFRSRKNKLVISGDYDVEIDFDNINAIRRI